jgi:hypothetical protein
MKSRRMSWVGHVAHMVAARNAYKMLMRILWKERGQLEDLGVDGRIILE